jgi:uncharacterized lipoprotein YmbA
MNHLRSLGSLSLGILLAACSTTEHKIADFAQNPEIYSGLDYTSRLPGDRTVFLAPVADQRDETLLPKAQGQFPIVYDDENRWNRSIPEMLDEVLRNDLEQSKVFAKVAEKAADADIVIQPTLLTFVTGAMELDSGAQAISQLGLKVQVLGSIDENGMRPVLLEQLYGERQLSDAGMRTPSRVLLTGRVVRTTMQKLVRSLDTSNVGRNGMPLVTPLGSEVVPNGLAVPAR